MHELTQQLECEEKLNLELAKKLEDQIVITNKTELVFNTQEKLVNSKKEIIENLKIIITQQKNGTFCCCKEDGMTSNLESTSYLVFKKAFYA